MRDKDLSISGKSFRLFLIISDKRDLGGGRFAQNSIRTIKSRLSADSSRKTDVTMIGIAKKQALGGHFVQSLCFFRRKSAKPNFWVALFWPNTRRRRQWGVPPDTV